jgi:chromosome segregation ATPase
MNLFKPKKKTIEITYIQENVILVRGEKFHRHDHELQEIRNALALLIKQNKKIIMTNQELKDLLVAANAKVDKIKTEIQALKDLVANSGNVPQDVVDAVNALGTNLQSADDLDPDA